ncbi:hypothetical protein AB205_0087200 [Aquarana catesbeiana]|uniref:Transmembrane protein n=1 Tax=Aquarana catesbeiana TaxID=8400 RepID=A0A2G9Q4L1_AQUCT|nr:hypothetical protein AB205_0087200 [Aquarana catesbeiana]
MSPGKTGNSNESYYSGQSRSLLIRVACLFLCIGGAVWGTGRPGCIEHRSRCMGHRSRCIWHRSHCIDTRAAVGGGLFAGGPHTTFCYGALLFLVTPLPLTLVYSLYGRWSLVTRVPTTSEFLAFPFTSESAGFPLTVQGGTQSADPKIIGNSDVKRTKWTLI